MVEFVLKEKCVTIRIVRGNPKKEKYNDKLTFTVKTQDAAWKNAFWSKGGKCERKMYKHL